MRVTFCAYDFVSKVGGPNAWLLRLLPTLQEMGVDVSVLFLSQDPLCSPTAAALCEKGVQTVVVKHFPTTEQKVRWILEQVKINPPDVFVPNLVVPAYYAGGWVRQAGIPTVGVLHSDDAFHRGLQEVFLFGDEFFRLSGLVCVSDYLQQEVLQQNPLDVDICKLPCGAPVPSEQAALPVNALRLAYVGRLEEEQKRISDVTKALCRVVKEVPGVEATLFGEGSARSAVEEILEAHGQGLPISLAGKVPSEQIQQLLLQQHVVILLSDYEGLPIALMEAMACGLVPICKSISSGIPELIDDGVSGLLVQDRGDEFVAEVRRLKDEPGLWQKLSIAARDKIVRDYSHTACAEGWFAFLEGLACRTDKYAKIHIPDKLVLPPVHPSLAREDIRAPSRYSVLVNKAAGLVKRLLGLR